MSHITDLPLEILELTLILCLGIGLYWQHRQRKRDRASSQHQLNEANHELKHLRRMLDHILMVERGYARPADSVDEETEVATHEHHPDRHR